jgi:MFS family permease
VTQSYPFTVESKDSWATAWAALFVLTMSFGTNWIITVGLADIAVEVGGSRSVPAMASSLAWFGSGIGGIVMAQVADRIGMRVTVIFGAFMIALGLVISTAGPSWPLWIGQGLFVGVLGAGSINAPMYIYVGRWFDCRRGSALALISSGTSLAGRRSSSARSR